MAHKEAEEIELELSDAPTNVEKFEVNHTDISSQVAEPVRVKAGNLVMNEDQEYTESEPLSNPMPYQNFPKLLKIQRQTMMQRLTKRHQHLLCLKILK